MAKQRTIFFALFMIVALLLPSMAFAQDDMMGDVLAEGLRNPRNFSFDADGNLYIAEAGLGGSEMTANEDPFGASSQITMVAPDGSSEVVVRGLISYREGNPLGAHDVQVTEDSIWVLLGETADFAIPFTHALVALDRETGRVQTFVDLLELELTDDPDGNANEQSNPMDLEVLDDGSVLIANAGCNCLMAWSADAGLSVAAVWSFEDDNPVPTTVDVGPDGDIYVGFLTGFPFPEAGSRIERWSGGELAQTYEGLTAVTGVLVADDGTIYASELGVFAQGEGWSPGRVVIVSEDGVTPVLEGLVQPFGLAQGPDGTIAVAVGTTGADDGMIVAIPMN
jgi:hypothetical protein